MGNNPFYKAIFVTLSNSHPVNFVPIYSLLVNLDSNRVDW